VAAKLHPRAVTVRPLFRAMLDYWLGEEWSTPRLKSMGSRGSSDVCGRWEGELWSNHLCDRHALVSEILIVAEEAKLTPRERNFLLEHVPPFPYKPDSNGGLFIFD
jgi:hypothetical protein